MKTRFQGVFSRLGAFMGGVVHRLWGATGGYIRRCMQDARHPLSHESHEHAKTESHEHAKTLRTPPAIYGPSLLPLTVPAHTAHARAPSRNYSLARVCVLLSCHLLSRSQSRISRHEHGAWWSSALPMARLPETRHHTVYSTVLTSSMVEQRRLIHKIF